MHRSRRDSTAWAVIAAIAAGAFASPGEACERARATTAPTPLPERWQAAVDELVVATGEAGQPWACGGGELRIEIIDDGAILRVDRAGAESMARHVDTPEELVPAGKAMLATPFLGPRATPAPSPVPAAALQPRGERPAPSGIPVTRASGETGEGPEEAVRGARLFVDATGALRYQGVVDAFTAGGGARMSVPLGRFVPAIWARYTTLIADLDEAELELSALDVGASLGFAVIDEPVRFNVGLYGGIALIDMEAESAGEDEREVELRALDGRLGTELRLSVPIVSLLRALVALDAEIAPASLADGDRRIDPTLPPLPAYGVGLGAGLEVEIP